MSAPLRSTCLVWFGRPPHDHLKVAIVPGDITFGVSYVAFNWHVTSITFLSKVKENMATIHTLTLF